MNLGFWKNCKASLGDPRVPGILALGAVLVMLPALNAGLGMDDLVQRCVQLAPAQLPPQLRESGVPQRSGTLAIVTSDLFGFHAKKEQIALARNYGLLPWWMREDAKAALWRPLTAFTHWLDYRLFPASPALMHAHNIAWFAGAVFVAALLYREVLGPGWVAGLAGLLFLLDKNSYFPVMFVANRGFIASLFFGLLCVYEHHQWRSTAKPWRAVISILALLAALFSNEAGVSTLAFLLAYACFLEKQGRMERAGDAGRVPGFASTLWPRTVSVLPALAVVLLWRVLYQGLGFGVAHTQAYIDPSQEPVAFLARVGPRSLALLAGQLTGVGPEMGMALHPALKWWLLLGAAAVVAVVALGMIPLLQREPAARFWFASMLLALVPAATVVPMSKNLAFVAVAAFGWIAMLLGEMGRTLKDGKRTRVGTFVIWLTGLGLLLAHVPGAIAGRIAVATVTPVMFKVMQRPGDIGDWSGSGETDVVLLNSPSMLSTMATPFVKTYEGKAVPRTFRSLVPGCTAFEIRRVDERTLYVCPLGPNIFAARQDRLFHAVHVFREADRMFRREAYSPGWRVNLTGLQIEVLEVDAQQLPSLVSFRFAHPLESSSFRWFYFDWPTFHPQPFALPAPGQSVLIAGPRQKTSPR